MSKDATLEHEAVKAYRDQFKLNVNLGFREDIISTVTNLELWKTVLANWGYWKEAKWNKFNPRNVKGLLSEYDLRERQSKRANVTNGQSVEFRPNDQNNPARLPERRDSRMSVLRQRERVDVRSGGQTLDDILAQAMQRLSKTG